MKTTLDLAFIHLDVKYAAPATNRKRILEKLALASYQGADIVIAPEMATSGYAFDNSTHAAKYAENMEDHFIAEVRRTCAKIGCWACIGMPLTGKKTGTVYNGAVIVDNCGQVRVKYHKVMAEKAWATQGVCDSSGVVDTPWGKIGVLICSDTYYGMLPRMRKLQGADLLLVPANWPSSTLDPQRLWRVHARLSGLYLAVCNRTGKDRTLDCTNAVSCCYSPNGELLFEGRNYKSAIFTVSIPLHNGRLKTPPCNTAPTEYFSTSVFDKHANSTDNKGKLHVYACNCTKQYKTICEKKQFSAPISAEDSLLTVCYGCDDEKNPPQRYKTLFKVSRTACVAIGAKTPIISILEPKNMGSKAKPANVLAPHTCRINGINIAIVTVKDALYPELIFRLAEAGCDVVVVSGDVGTNTEDILYNCVHRMIIVCSSGNKVCISVPPAGHETWGNGCSGETGVYSAIVARENIRNREWLRKINSICTTPAKTCN